MEKDTLMHLERHLLDLFFYPNANEIMIEPCSIRSSKSAANVTVKAMVSCHISCYFLILFFHFILTSVCILHHEICSFPEKEGLLPVMQTQQQYCMTGCTFQSGCHQEQNMTISNSPQNGNVWVCITSAVFASTFGSDQLHMFL